MFGAGADRPESDKASSVNPRDPTNVSYRLTLTGAKPYLDWTRKKEAGFSTEALRVVRARTFGSAFLLPEFELEEDVQEWIEENAEWLFEFQLAAWTEDESTWPSARDLKAFREWFRVDIHNIVVDVADDEIEGEEL